MVPSVVMPMGLLKDAAVPIPSTLAAAPEPANVDTMPEAITIWRTVRLTVSVMYRLTPSVVMCGVALEAKIFIDPLWVLTSPVAMTILRIFPFPLSTTYRLVPSVVMSPGELKDDAVPMPSTLPAVPDPASVHTCSLAMLILVILFFEASVTYRLAPSVVIPRTLVKAVP